MTPEHPAETPVSSPPVPSPCVNICRLVPLPDGGEFCAGCLRTPQEIMHWPVADDAWRREVWRRIALRRG